MSRPQDLRRRLLRGVGALLLAGSLAGPGLVAAHEAAPTAETEIVISVADGGTFDIGWTTDPVAFLTDAGADPVLTASSTSVHVSATFVLTVDDSRQPGQTPGYSVTLQCSDLTTEGGATIPASTLIIESVSVENTHRNIVPSVAAGATCGSPLTLYAVEKGGNVESTITLVIGTTLPSTTAPGTYTGTVTLEPQGTVP